MDMVPKVTIAGAGIAGLAAALRLLERGFAVTLFEESDCIGGMLRGYQLDTGEYYEHSYHMFVNWYYNFWQIVYDIGAQDNFAPRTTYKVLHPGEFPQMRELVNVGSPGGLWRNLFSGVAPAPDMFIYLYSMLDLLATPLHRRRFLDEISVNGFMHSRPYATPRAAELHEKLWETVWAIPSYGSSATAYQTFLKYGYRVPTPMMWLLKGNKYEFLMKPMETKLCSFGDRFHLRPCTRVTKVVLEGGGRVGELEIQPLQKQEGSPPAYWQAATTARYPIEGDVVLAVTPGSLATLVDADLYRADPELGEVLKVQSEPMASVALYFNRQLPDIPPDLVVLMEAKYEMTFLDYSQLSTKAGASETRDTLLYVTVSDFHGLKALPAGDPPWYRAGINLDKPASALDYILLELRRFLPFDVRDISQEKTRINTATGEALFANVVGSERYRPVTTCRVPNLFLAGNFCQTFVDIATVESAVVSGLLAAEEVRRRAGVGAPIRIVKPDHYPESLLAALKVLWAPYAYGAKVWSWLNEALERPYRG